MLRTLLIGLGRSGTGLHLPVLLRARGAEPGLFAAGPVVGVDPGRTLAAAPDGLTVAADLRDARRLLDPDTTVVHLCTPPAVRDGVLEEVAALGFRRLVVEKPLAADRAALHRVRAAVDRHRLDVTVVAPWLHSALTDRLAALLGDGSLGAVRHIGVTQHKPRFRRSLTAPGHTSAFEVEVPHAVGVLLRLLGDARTADASWSDVRLGDAVAPRLGTARLRLAHATGGHSEVYSDLTSPVRRRRIVIETDRARLTGDYPVSEDDDVAQLLIERRPGGGPTTVTRELLPDDALTRCLVRAYRHAAGRTAADDRALPGGPGDLGLHIRTVELLDDARRLAATVPPLHPRTTDRKEVAGHAG
ncbi:hypothetical protein [Streptomyces catenulae]|uniref:Oxidoreductase n=1 Tax=Streptomyces catenulae TaxID=66875 RepID=A0ABV2YZS6_9ACTN|nr:hypothetical protein [Streptomyces catenulae]